jgi:hypothetical protein
VWLAFLATAAGATTLVDAPPASFAALVLAAFRLTALVVAVGALPRARAARTLAAVWLAVEIAADYQLAVHDDRLPTAARAGMIALAAALALIAPWARTGTPPLEPSRAFLRAWQALVALSAFAIAGGVAAVVAVRSIHDIDDPSLVALPRTVAWLAFPVSLVAVALLASLQLLARLGRLARVGATLLTAAILLEILQGIAIYRGWSSFSIHGPSFAGWLGGAALLGPALEATGLLLLGIAAETAVRGRGEERPWHTTGYVVGAISIVVATLMLAVNTLPLHAVPDPDSETHAWPAIATRSVAFVAVPWALSLCVVPALRRAASFGADARVPPPATAR